MHFRLWLLPLWVLAMMVMFVGGELLLPKTGSRWLDALIWAGYASILIIGPWLISRRDRGRGEVIYPPAYVLLFVMLCVGADRLMPVKDEPLRVVILGVAIGVIAGLARWVAGRRGRRKREAELARLARQF